jgi:glycosyltransferase involved in cell wall biosynthesis
MLAWEYPPHVVGGLGRHVAELAPALAQQGVNLCAVTPRWAGGDPVSKSPGLTIYRVDPPSVSMPDYYTAVWQTNLELQEVASQLCQSEDAQLVHNHDWLTVFAAVALKRSSRLPLVSTVHATERGRAHGEPLNDQQHAIDSAEWWLTYESWRVICCSQYMASEVASSFNVPGDKIDVIPNGVLSDRFARWDGADLSLFRGRFALPWEQIVFYVGRVVQEKGLHVLLEAVPRVLAEQPNAKFVIAGTGYALEALRSRAWELGVGEKLLFTGYISDDDRDRLFRIAACAVFPSLYEPFGIVALEAMAAGTPVVVSSVGGLREVVKHAETGVTVYPDNPESLAWGINHTLARPDWAVQRAKNARSVVLEEYNWNRIAEQTMEVYDRVIDERSAVSW